MNIYSYLYMYLCIYVSMYAYMRRKKKPRNNELRNQMPFNETVNIFIGKLKYSYVLLKKNRKAAIITAQPPIMTTHLLRL